VVDVYVAEQGPHTRAIRELHLGQGHPRANDRGKDISQHANTMLLPDLPNLFLPRWGLRRRTGYCIDRNQTPKARFVMAPVAAKKATVAGLLAAVALAACAIPGRRAIRV